MADIFHSKRKLNSIINGKEYDLKVKTIYKTHLAHNQLYIRHFIAKVISYI